MEKKKERKKATNQPREDCRDTERMHEALNEPMKERSLKLFEKKIILAFAVIIFACSDRSNRRNSRTLPFSVITSL